MPKCRLDNSQRPLLNALLRRFESSVLGKVAATPSFYDRPLVERQSHLLFPVWRGPQAESPNRQRDPRALELFEWPQGEAQPTYRERLDDRSDTRFDHPLIMLVAWTRRFMPTLGFATRGFDSVEQFLDDIVIEPRGGPLPVRILTPGHRLTTSVAAMSYLPEICVGEAATVTVSDAPKLSAGIGFLVAAAPGSLVGDRATLTRAEPVYMRFAKNKKPVRFDTYKLDLDGDATPDEGGARPMSARRVRLLTVRHDRGPSPVWSRSPGERVGDPCDRGAASAGMAAQRVAHPVAEMPRFLAVRPSHRGLPGF